MFDFEARVLITWIVQSIFQSKPVAWNKAISNCIVLGELALKTEMISIIIVR